MIERGFDNKGEVLKNAAYQQSFRLRDLPDEIVTAILRMLKTMTARGTLQRDRHITRSHLNRFSQAREFLKALDRLLLVQYIDLITTALYALFPILILINWDIHQPLGIYFFVGVACTVFLLQIINNRTGQVAFIAQRRALWKFFFTASFFTTLAILALLDVSSYISVEDAVDIAVREFTNEAAITFPLYPSLADSLKIKNRAEELADWQVNNPVAGLTREQIVRLTPEQVASFPVSALVESMVRSDQPLSDEQWSTLTEGHREELLFEVSAWLVMRESTAIRDLAASTNQLEWRLRAIDYARTGGFLPVYILLLVTMPLLIFVLSESTAQVVILSTTEQRAVKAFFWRVWNKLIEYWEAWKDFSPAIKAWTLAGLFLFVASYLVIVAIIFSLSPASVTSQEDEGLTLVLVAFGSFFLVLFVYGLFVTIATLTDWIRLRILLRRRSRLQPLDFIANCGKFRFSKYRASYVANVRRKGLLIPTYKTSLLLEKLVTHIEQVQTIIHMGPPTSEHALVKNWYLILLYRFARTTDASIVYEPLPLFLNKLWSRVIYNLGTNQRRQSDSRDIAQGYEKRDEFEQWRRDYCGWYRFRLAAWAQPEFDDELCLLLEQIRASSR
jgi:hypothetical protein